MLNKQRFTFLEVLIAVAILGLGLAMLLSEIAGARTRILRAQRAWGRAHCQAQASELFLLAGPKAEAPARALPDHFSMRCELTAVDDLADEVNQPVEGWVLGQFRISVFGLRGEEVSSTVIQKLVLQEDL